ncbi:MAG TPA: hypothetical protein VGV37_02390 [Aliidongia sp.]|uniref:hypothetical protein n=1 Tax=Aliidongia sp. TaxID=1914230 RepID=UPI002DDD2BC3|nr:hypothetical protein [Aliidongia sp.]HEV2673359.1 hypothetical protein [Aliidongia sp.]
MRPSVLLPIIACLASAGCSTVSQTLSTDVWLCAYQLGDRYRDEAVKPDVVKYDLTVISPVRRTDLTYLLPIAGGEPEKHTLTCEAAPWGFGTVAADGFKLDRPAPDVYPGNASENFTAQGRNADAVRDAVRQTGIHVHIPGVENF